MNIKTATEIQLMREAGQLLAQVFAELDKFVKVGVSTKAINDHATHFMVKQLHARPASIGQYNYPYASNISVNNVVCHGVPSDTQIVQANDIFNVDITLEKNGFIADSSKMFVMPEASDIAKKLVKTTYQAMWKGIEQVKAGNTLGDIGAAIQKYAEINGFSVVKEYGGHGIGREMHELPHVHHYGKAGTGAELQAGMTFTIEPMINQGSSKIKHRSDQWTVVTKDKKLSAQWEHTVLVTETGYEVLTLREEEIDLASH